MSRPPWECYIIEGLDNITGPPFPICCAGAHAGADTPRRASPGAGAQHHQRAGFDAVDASTAQRAL